MTSALEEATVDSPLAPGAEIAPGYAVVEHLSRGEALDVYDVWSEERACRCVAKTLRPDRRADERPRLRLAREGELLARFTHPHLVRAYETLEAPELVVVLETLSGATLSYVVSRRRRRLSSADLAVLGTHLCSALHYLHRHRLLHLDVKPSNVVVDRGRAKLLDLSLARPPGPGSRGVGTSGYQAPEQARGDPFVEATDVWGLGATLYVAASGRRPFAPDDRESEDRYPQLERRAPSLRRHRRRLPPAFTTAVDGCLAPEPGDRPTVAELVTVFTALVPALAEGVEDEGEEDDEED